MTDKKLTDGEIVKALEDLVKCNNNEIDCDNCSLSVFYPRCPEEIGELSLDLINRLKADIERLKESLNIELENYATEYDSKIKAEAYKEFAEKAKEFMHNKFKTLDEYEFEYITERDIDKLAKELVGDDNA